MAEIIQNNKTFDPKTWLKKYGIQKQWILRHIPAPWDKSVRVSPLSISAYENNVSMLKWLIDNGCAKLPVNQKAPMRIAIQKGNMESVLFLQDIFGDDVFTHTEEVPKYEKIPCYNRKNKKKKGIYSYLPPPVPGDSLLHAACRAGSLDGFRHVWDVLKDREEVGRSFGLIKPGQFLGSMTDSVSYRIKNALTGDELFHAAVYGESVELLEHILEGLTGDVDDDSTITDDQSAALSRTPSSPKKKSAVPLAINAPNLSGYTPFILACKDDILVMAQRLFASGADIRAKTKSGNSAIMWAALNGHKEVLEWLIQVGSETSGDDDGGGGGGDRLLPSDGEGSFLRDQNNIGATPLMASVKNSHLGAASLLFEGGARLDIGVCDKDARCPMSYACINNDVEAVKWLKHRFEENKVIEKRLAESTMDMDGDSKSKGSNRNYGIDHR